MNPGDHATSVTYTPGGLTSGSVAVGDDVGSATYNVPTLFSGYVYLTDEFDNILTDEFGALIYVDTINGESSTTYTVGSGITSVTLTVGDQV